MACYWLQLSENTRRVSVGLLLVQRRRRWKNIEPEKDQHLVFSRWMSRHSSYTAARLCILTSPSLNL